MMSVLAFLAGSALRVSVILAVAGVCIALMKDQSAAKRHSVWLVAIICALLLPIASALMPRVTVTSFAPEEFSLARFVVAEREPAAALRSPEQESRTFAVRDAGIAADTPANGTRWNLQQILVITWLAGFTIIVVRSVAGIVRMRRIVTRARTVDDSHVSALVDRLATPAWRGRIRLVESAEVGTPLSTCVHGHAIVLPASRKAWADRELQLVLAHETAHITRYDCLSHFAGTFLTAIHWFNPLAWRAARALRFEAEQACDDLALASDVEPVVYAELLVSFARSSTGPTLAGALPMTSTSAELERRLTAIVDVSRRRESCSWRCHAVGATCGAAIVMAVSAPTLAAKAVETATPVHQPPVATPTEHRPASPLLRKREQAPERVAPDTGSDDERLPLDDTVMRAARGATQTLTGADSALAALLFARLDHVPSHELDLVRERAAWALSRSRGNAIVTPLIDALRSRDWREVAYAAWALSASRDSRAVIPLVGVLTHDAWRVRANAAAALNGLGDPRATDAMRTLLGDAAWQVRAEAVQFLGSVGDTQPLQKMLNDPHIAVRSAAETALIPAGRSR